MKPEEKRLRAAEAELAASTRDFPDRATATALEWAEAVQRHQRAQRSVERARREAAAASRRQRHSPPKVDTGGSR